MVADVVLLNPSTVIDRSTFNDPTALPVGVEKVLVGGELVWDGGEPVMPWAGPSGRVVVRQQ